MKTLITGAAGFIGSHLTEELLKRGHEVYALIRPGAKLTNLKQHITGKEGEKILTNNTKLKIINCDLLEKGRIEEIIKKIKPDIIYHYAAQPFVKPSWEDPVNTIKINVIGTTRIYETIKKEGLKTKVVVACSSAAYGTTTEKKTPIKEEDPLKAIHPYGISKAATELMGRQYYINFGIPVINLRYFNQTGPKKTGDACSDFARNVARITLGLQEPIIEVGNLEAYRDITGIKDTINATLTASKKGTPGETYNVCSGVKTKIRDVLEYAITLSDKEITIKENTKNKLRKTDEDIIVGDNSKLRRLGYEPTQSYKEIIKDMYQYWINYYQSRQALILAGGLGTRLRSKVNNKPKPMAEFNKKPFLDYQLKLLRDHVNEVILCSGYLREQIREYYGDNKHGLKITHSMETERLGTGGAIKNAEQLIDQEKPLIILNGDTYMELDYETILKKHQASGIKNTMIITKTANPKEVGIVKINKKGLITGFKEKPENPTKNDKWMNAGAYILNPNMIKNIPQGKVSLEKTIFPELIKQGMRTEKNKGYFIDIGTPKNYEKFKEHSKKLTN